MPLKLPILNPVNSGLYRIFLTILTRNKLQNNAYNIMV